MNERGRLRWVTTCGAMGAGFIVAMASMQGVAADSLAGSTTTTAASTSSSKPTTRLVIATYNIEFLRHGAADLASITAAVRKTGADVIAVQECNSEVIAGLKKEFAKEYPYVQWWPGALARGFAWFSKWPLTDLAMVPSPGGVFDARIACVKVEGQKAQLVNIHLCPTIPDAGAGVAAVLAQYERDEQTRLREIKAILARAAKDLPVVLLGDFNSRPDGAVSDLLRGRKYIDSLADANDGAADLTTWHGQRAGVEWKFRLDYIWHTPGLQTGSCKVIEAGPSDHYPVVAQIDWPGGPAPKPPATSCTATHTTPAAGEGSQ